MAAQHTHMAVTGMTLVGHLHFGAIQNDLTSEEAEHIFEEVRQAVPRLTDEQV